MSAAQEFTDQMRENSLKPEEITLFSEAQR